MQVLVRTRATKSKFIRTSDGEYKSHVRLVESELICFLSNLVKPYKS